jgi:hypothetical protein
VSDKKDAPSNSSAALIEEAKKERQRLLAQIEQSQRTIEHSDRSSRALTKCLRLLKRNSAV